MDRNVLAGDLALDAVDRRDLRGVEPRLPRGLLPKGVTALPDQELCSPSEEDSCGGDAIKTGENIPLAPSGGVRSSSPRGDAVDNDVRDVGPSASGLVGDTIRLLLAGRAR